MKQLLTFFLTALLAFSVGWAETVTDYITRNLTGVTVTSYTAWSGKQSNSDAVYAGQSAGGNSSVQLRATKPSGIVTTASGGKVKSVTVAWNTSTANGRTLNVYGKNSAYTESADLYDDSKKGELLGTIVYGTNTSLTIEGDYEYIGLVSASNAMYLTNIKIEWEVGGASAVASPSFAPAGGDFVSEQDVTLSCETAGASIYYTLDGSEPTSNSTLYNGPIHLTETKTIKAVAILDGESSSVVSATYTKTGVSTIEEAYNYTQGSTFTFTGNAIVTYQSPNGQYLFIRDDSKSGLIYCNSNPGTFSNGDILDANWTAKNTMFGSIPEFTTPSGLNSTANGGAVAPFDHTADGITTANVNEYVSFSNVTLSWSTSVGYCYFTVGNRTIYLRDFFNNGLSVSSGKTYDIEGVAYIYNNNVYVYLTKVTEIVPTVPTVLVDPAELTISDSGTDNTFAVTGTNLATNVGVSPSTGFGVEFSSTLNLIESWGFVSNNGSVDGTVSVNYTGRKLSATGTVTAATEGDSKTVQVTYVPDLYIVGNYASDWDFTAAGATAMTNNNGIYTATLENIPAGSYILFARKAGVAYTWENDSNRLYIGASTDGGDWKFGTNTSGALDTDPTNDSPVKYHPIVFPQAGTYTITIDANAGTFSITKESQSTGDFVLVTDASQLAAGNEVIIVNSSTAGAARTMGQRNNNNYFGTAVEVTATQKVAATDATQIFTLESATNGWYFKTSDGQYLKSGTTSSNYLQTGDKDASNGIASITIDNNNIATIVFNGNGSRKNLRYNPNGITSNPNNNDIFSCYQATSQNNVYLYQRTGTVVPTITVDPASLSFVVPADGTPQSQTVTVTESNTTGTTSVSIDGAGAANYSATLDNGTLTVTYSGNATQANPDEATITLTNGDATATVTVTGYKAPVTLTITPADGHTFQGSTVSGLIESNVDGAVIEYSLDGTTWQTYDPNEGFTATVSTVGGTVTVYARTTVNGETATAQATYTRIAKATTCQATIVFAPTTNNGEMSQWSTLKTHIGEGADYISSAEVSKLYTSSSNASMRFGSGSYTGSLDLTLDLSKFEGGSCKLNRVIINAAPYGSDAYGSLTVSTNVAAQGEVTNNIPLEATGFADYNFNFTDHSEITTLSIANNSTSGRVYVHSITIEYNCSASIEAPIIEPATGTYYGDQTVTITDATSGAAIYYTTDGSDPTPSSTPYTEPFVVPYTSGSTTVKAIAVLTEDGEQQMSDVSSVTYTWGMPSVTIHPDSRSTAEPSVNVTLTGTPADAVIYYTTDGSVPSATNGTQYTGAFSVALDEVGDQVTVNAIAITGELTSTMASATYTRVDHVVEVNAPFLSPLHNHVYYGDQTLQIGCTTPNADIYYEIVEVEGETAPSASSVEEPTHASTYYNGSTINMTAGHSYYVKAIAYIGSFASTVSEGWYTVKPFTQTGYYYQNLKDFNDNCPTDVTAHLVNPVQVVYHSTYTNNGEFAEYCYLRDNTDYACVYFGKRDNSGKTIFKMGDWLDGSEIAGKTNIWDRNFHIQLGTQAHEVTSWPTEAIGWSEILPEEITNAVIVAGTAEGSNSWGHYVHLRNTTLHDVDDYSESDPKHTGKINDGTADAYYYDKFYRWSAGTCTYNGHDDVIQHMGDYDQAFFTAKQQAGATFDVYGIVDYYSQYTPPFEICPIDFLWAYKPVITPGSNLECTSQQEVTITVQTPEWTTQAPVIYYKTDDMEEWAVYTGTIIVNSDTHIDVYAEVPAVKSDGTNYNDYVRSDVVSADYKFIGIEDPEIAPASKVIEIVTGNEVEEVMIAANNGDNPDVITVYTTDGTTPGPDNGTRIAAGDVVEIDVNQTTTITVVSYLPDAQGNPVLYSNTVSETYTFVKKNGIIYDLVKTAPRVGNVYVIVNKDAYMGMSTTQNENNRGSVGVMFTDGSKDHVYGNDELALFVLEQASAGRYYFKNINGNGYLTVTGNTGLKTGASDSYAEAGIQIGGQAAGYPAAITFSYDGTPRTMRYFAKGRTFSTYTDATLNQDVFLYGVEATPLAYIESTPSLKDKQVTVSDQLIGAWAVVNSDKGIRQLWAKDQGNQSIDKRPAMTSGQTDYLTDILKYQNRDWDESNWVVLDFSNVTGNPEDYVGHKLQSLSVIGRYTDVNNYTIQLIENPGLVSETQDATDYPGYQSGYLTENAGHMGSAYDLAYNTYVPANFMTYNLNRLEDGMIVGAVGGDNAVGSAQGDSIYFMNPKIQEVVRLWGVWCGAGSDRFAVYATDGKTVNAWDIDGAASVISWDYNLKQNGTYGPADLVEDQAYEFHAAIVRLDGYTRNASASESAASGSYGIYPLDLPDGGNPTAVKDVTVGKTVESVRYYNVMGQESDRPVDGVNIIVTRYTDGTTSTIKVQR